MQNWNPYYVAYAKVHGTTPEARLEKDKEIFPGGCMCGFTLWIRKVKNAFYESHYDCFIGPDTICDHDAWGDFVGKTKIKLDFV